MESEYIEWADKYKPIVNHLSGDSECTMFDDYGKQKQFVHDHHASQVWTLVWAEGNLYICQGFHHVNRMGYFIASVPFIDGNKDEYLDTDNADDDWDEKY